MYLKKKKMSLKVKKRMNGIKKKNDKKEKE